MKDKNYEEIVKSIKSTLIARIIPNLPLDTKRQFVKDVITNFEFDEYLEEQNRQFQKKIEKIYKKRMEKTDRTDKHAVNVLRKFHKDIKKNTQRNGE